jgi:hypothetical protein
MLVKPRIIKHLVALVMLLNLEIITHLMALVLLLKPKRHKASRGTVNAFETWKL